MELEFDLNMSVDENAGIYFDLSKKARKKVEGAKKALEESRKKLLESQSKEDKFWQEEEKKKVTSERKREWYEKFHWFISSEGFLCIGGKDATSNEIVIKKHTDKEDLVFHTDMSGSPFFVVKKGSAASEKTRMEAAQAVGVYSRAWKLGHTTADVFYVQPEQVTKEAQSGEHLAKGSFMIMGKTLYLYPRLEYAIGLVRVESGEADKENHPDGKSIQEQVIGGPVSAVSSKTANFIIVIPGKEKKSSLAKKIKQKLKGGDLDEIIKFLPAGGGEVK
ncbi:DUF814 domain-containing protein [Candidatus Woesearchaeota archaeon]|nr:DUF814 domain-containing protein [Candidatus Woesearchaeota archaeon]